MRPWVALPWWQSCRDGNQMPAWSKWTAEQVDGGGMPEAVWADPPSGARVVEAGCMPTDDLLDAVAGEGLPVSCEHWLAGRGRPCWLQ